jgi:CMP-N-acetylneuraminic acid synthetase
MVKITPSEFIPAIIPARGGSLRLPGKNCMEIDGRSLIGHAVQAAKESEYISAVYVTSDDDDILRHGESYGAESIKRPDELATASALAKGCAIHALAHIQELGHDVRTFVYLQPTSPLRHARDVDACIKMYKETDHDTVISIVESEVPPGRLWTFREKIETYFEGANPFLLRQQQDLSYRPNGAVYVCNVKAFLDNREAHFFSGSVGGYKMPQWRSIDIDTRFDFEVTKAIMENELIDAE